LQPTRDAQVAGRVPACRQLADVVQPETQQDRRVETAGAQLRDAEADRLELLRSVPSGLEE